MKNTITQTGLVFVTLFGAGLISFGYSNYGVIVNFLAQGFWLFNTYTVWKSDKTQWGMFVLSLIMAVVVGYGVINYWL